MNTKSYVGRRRAGGARVFVREGDAERPLVHHVRHSPGGFEWGYAGSGPAELARCILIDFFGDRALCGDCVEGSIETNEGRERCRHCGGEGLRLPVDYQQFKFEFITTLDRDDWEIEGGEIEQWVRGRRAVADAPAARGEEGSP